MVDKKKGQRLSRKEQVLGETTRDDRLAFFSKALVAWFEQNGRDLPWRRTRDPYKILVSEIMLQQTNVDIVIPIYSKFLKRFPTIQTLAKSSIQDVKKITDELGYKRRGEYLHEIAKQIFYEKKGQFPSNLDELLALKGIGRYTAGAILSFAFEKTAAIVDVNVERVLARIFGLWDWEKNAKFEKEIWKLSEAMIENGKNVWTVNQSILDLGATICIAQKPKCPICPMVEICEYYDRKVPKITPLDSFFSS
ncbi:MAG: A/G-specific adenine glycosylase [Candidatus Heimdallarchaeota archaeon]|nr:MAG: A/G-specific adenine glycosylase [Candidatus Heimdallarchaeota archaeon]